MNKENEEAPVYQEQADWKVPIRISTVLQLSAVEFQVYLCLVQA